jgi:UDPglucose 6-dehydrogenase
MAVMAQNCPGVCFTVVDVCAERIRSWNSTKLPIYEPGLDVIVTKTRGVNLFFTTDMEKSINTADIIFIAVGTPTKTYGEGRGSTSELANWESATRSIAAYAREPKIIVEKSTVPVGTAKMVADILSQNTFGCRHLILSNPEFLAEGTAVHDLQFPSRVLIGGENPRAVEELKSLYGHWVPQDRILTTNTWSAELSKLAANAFLAQRVSSVNSLTALCEVTGANIHEVTKVVGMDPRIGPGFLQPSVGFGGSCFKKDILNLVYICRSEGLVEVAAYWEQVILMNQYQKSRFAKMVWRGLFRTLKGKKLTVLGFAFKKNTGDTRDSAAIDICRDLLREGAQLSVYDPMVTSDTIMNDLGGNPMVAVHTDPVTAAQDSHALLVLTEWDEFQTLPYDTMFQLMQKPAYVFDGRGVTPGPTLREIGYRVLNVGYC